MNPLLACCLTPPGKSAIAVLGLGGDEAWSVARSLFRRKKGDLPDTPMPGESYLGWLGDDSPGGADEVVLLVKAKTLEFHCHGGPRVIRLLLEQLHAKSAEVVSWQQFAREETKAMLWAQEILMQAPTVRTAGIALDQVNGAFPNAIDGLLAEWDENRFQRLLDLIPVGRHLVRPWKVVLAGAPNVGKSSLINALAGFTRSVVSPISGTTRDVVTTLIAIDGWPIELSDTAGLHGNAKGLEREGILRTRMALEEADLVLWVLDGSSEPIFPESEVPLVINKADLPPTWDFSRAAGAKLVSAQTGDGIRELGEWLAKKLVPHPPLPGEAVPYHEAWIRFLLEIQTEVKMDARREKWASFRKTFL